MSLSRNEVSQIIRRMNSPKNIRALSRVMTKAGMNARIKENAAKRVVGIRLSDAYRRRKQYLLNWVRKFNKAEMNRLLELNNNTPYTRRVNSIPNPPLTRTNLIKTVSAKYLLNSNVHWPNARNAVNRVHTLYGRPVANRIPNAPLVSFLMGLPNNRLHQMNNNLPFYKWEKVRSGTFKCLVLKNEKRPGSRSTPCTFETFTEKSSSDPHSPSASAS
jgi:hypothetical protein